MSHGQNVPVAHGKDQRSSIITAVIQLFQLPPWSRVNPHTSLQIYCPSLIWITSCNNLKTLALYHNLSNRRVSSCLVHYSQIHCLGCDSMATFIHVSPAGMFLRGGKKKKNITSIFLLYSTMNTIC